MNDRNDLNLLRRVAEDLQREGRYWKLFGRIEHLMGWLYDEGKCVYCGTELVETGHTISGLASTDHLLPKHNRPELDEDPLNAVPACSTCNHVKGQWDPNKSEGEPLFRAGSLTPEMRTVFIARAKNHIQEKRRARAVAFEQDLTAWRKALRSYRGDLSS